MVIRILTLITIIAISGCGKNEEYVPKTPMIPYKPAKDPMVELAESLFPMPQYIRYVNAEYNFDGKIMKIENLGWCSTNPGQSSRAQATDCSLLNDYSKIQMGREVYYLYRTISHVKPFMPLKSTDGLYSTKTKSSKQWNEAIKEHKSSAQQFEIKRSLSLKEWKYQNEILYKLDVSRCKLSAYYRRALHNNPRTLGNRLLNTDNIFYFDTMLNTVSPLEVDLQTFKIVAFPVSIDNRKVTKNDAWDNYQSLVGVNNELIKYSSDIAYDVGPIDRYHYFPYFGVVCGMHYSLVSPLKNQSNPSLSFFPTYNPSLDKEISAAVDEEFKLMDHAAISDSTEYRKILSKLEVNALIPASENLSPEALQFLQNGGFDIFNLNEFQNRSL